MPRIFHQVVFKDQVDGTIPMITGQEFYETLGRADELSVQTRATGSTGTSPTLTVELWGSNDGQNWVTLATLVNAANISSTPYESIADTTGTTLAAYLRFQMTLGGTSPTANVTIAVCGRTN